MSDTDSSLPAWAPPNYTPETGISSENILEASGSETLNSTSSTRRNDAYAPVVLTWDPPESYNVSAPIQISTSASSSHPRPSVRPPSPNRPSEDPPGYHAARIPTKPTTYTFSPLSFNSMLLIPPYDSPDSRPLYHICISMNCFMPSSYITTIRRSGSEFGELVAEFEMGISSYPSTLSIRGKEHKISDVLEKNGSHRAGIWRWKFVKKQFIWDFTKNPRTCYSTSNIVYARFRPNRESMGTGNSPKLYQLEITPAGQGLFDDILLSSLIIERKRLSPTDGESNKTLFS